MGGKNTDGLSVQEVFPDHNSVDRCGILKREERKTSRLAVCVPNDSACVDFAKLGKIVPQALWLKKEKHCKKENMEKKSITRHPHKFSELVKWTMTLQKGGGVR